ncbi:hypothetical protein HPB47_023312 [Ixodes persulcatus]|uniref:Uncharacterized protein n=1 Tax=Ixodes persulcatus TaxID=34615 RepID=A0AC60Q817_IXOPE|nr:hypothetical protein HPB47_023312 [Ixodes persulcatus]
MEAADGHTKEMVATPSDSREPEVDANWQRRDKFRREAAEPRKTITTKDGQLPYFRSEVLRTFATQHRRENAEDLLRTRVQGPNETVSSFVQDVLHLSTPADQQAVDDKKLRVLVRGVRDDIFGGLVRNPPTAVEAFVTEATNIERTLQARASHYQRHPGVAASTLFNGETSPVTPDICEIIRAFETAKTLRSDPLSLHRSRWERHHVGDESRLAVQIPPPPHPETRQLVTALLYSRILFGYNYHVLTPRQAEQLEKLNREAIRIVTGLPKHTPLRELYTHGGMNLLSELAEQALLAQRDRLSSSTAGLSILEELRVSPSLDVRPPDAHSPPPWAAPCERHARLRKTKLEELPDEIRPATYVDWILPTSRDKTIVFLLWTKLAEFVYDNDGPGGRLSSSRRRWDQHPPRPP